MAFSLPPLNNNLEIVTRGGKASNAFARYWQKLLSAITTQENMQDDLLAQIVAATNLAQQANTNATAAQAAANTANQTANSATLTFPAGSVTDTIWNCTDTVFTTVATVQLTGVTAGILKFTTTRLLVNSSSYISVAEGEYKWRLTEELASGGGETIIITGTFSVEKLSGNLLAAVFSDVTALDALEYALVNTGTVKYRLQIAKDTFTQPDMMNGLASLYVAQVS